MRKVKQYLDLYVNFKLKLQAATDEKLQTAPEFKAEADNFKKRSLRRITLMNRQT